jgi:hypothetical protein
MNLSHIWKNNVSHLSNADLEEKINLTAQSYGHPTAMSSNSLGELMAWTAVLVARVPSFRITWKV